MRRRHRDFLLVHSLRSQLPPPNAGLSHLRYTFATLGFATNASVIKLNPKKATVAASAAERKLMQELEEMKAAMGNAGKLQDAMVALKVRLRWC